jgi:hypothetical protein
VNIVFAVRSTQGFLNGSEVSELLRNLSVVEFSFYLGYPVLQIAEREYRGLSRRTGEATAGAVDRGISFFKILLILKRDIIYLKQFGLSSQQIDARVLRFPLSLALSHVQLTPRYCPAPEWAS